jgi:predicted house-cleaning noncanonical NTP pyrophosphatase (MazG superfamily)
LKRNENGLEVIEWLPTKKLVRDRIPEIIAASGRTAVTWVMEEAEYRRELRRKLHEELEEYLEAETDPAAWKSWLF